MKKVRIIISIMILTLCVQSISLTEAFADSTDETNVDPVTEITANENIETDSIKLAASAPQADLESYIASEMANFKTTIDISGYNYKYTSASNRESVKQKIFSAIVEAINNNPELFHVGTSYSVSYTISGNNTGRFTKITPKYIMTKSQAASTRVKFDAAVNKAVAGIKPTMTDEQKARVVHDYLALNAEYDLVNYNRNTVPVASYRANGVLVNRTGVCQSYAMAYKYILEEKLGITCGYASTSTHIWNLVKIGSKYYNVDVTWDDGTKSNVGTKYFLVSGSVMQQANKGKHINFEYAPSTANLTAPTKPSSTRISVAKAAVSAISTRTYTGRAIRPAVTVKVGGKTLRNGTNYTLTYRSNVGIGRGTVTITGKGSYAGSKSVSFRIIPKKMAVKKATAGKKKITVKWKKNSGGVTKYQVQYRQKGTKKWKTINVSPKKSSLVIKKLKKGKKYYVRIRSYRTVGKVKYYSTWSKSKISKKVKR